jgi:hypothetical protein
VRAAFATALKAIRAALGCIAAGLVCRAAWELFLLGWGAL